MNIVLIGMPGCGKSTVGVVLANFIPTHWGLGFAGILALLGLLCSLASSRLRWVSAGVDPHDDQRGVRPAGEDRAWIPLDFDVSGMDEPRLRRWLSAHVDGVPGPRPTRRGGHPRADGFQRPPVPAVTADPGPRGIGGRGIG